MSWKKTSVAVLTIAALALAACSSSDSADDSPGSSSDDPTLEERIADEIQRRSGVDVTVSCTGQAQVNPENLECSAEAGGGEREEFQVKVDGDNWEYVDDLPRPGE